MCKEKNIRTPAEQWHKHLKDKKRWLLDNQVQLLRRDITLKQIAQKFNTDMLFIREYRVQLRKLLKVSHTQQKINWAKQHQYDLETMTIVQL